MTGYGQSFSPLLRWGVAGVVVVAIVIALQPSFAAMLQLWLDIDTYNHCLLIAPISVWLIWRQRPALAAIQPSTSLPGLLMVVLVAGLWILGAMATIAVVQHFAAVGLIPLSLWAILGTPVARTIMFPLGYLLFLVPFGGFLISPLMTFTAEMTVAAVRVSGVAVYRDGLYFEIASGSFKIIEACSGIRMLMAAVAVGALFAYLNFRSWRRRTLFMGGVVALAIIANWIRAYAIVMVANFSGMDLIADHVWLGYVVFGIVLFIMLWAGSRFSDIEPGAGIVRHVGPGGQSAPGSAGGALTMASAIIVVVVSAPLFVATMAQQAVRPMTLPVAHLPLEYEGWAGPGPPGDDWSPDFGGDTMTQAGRFVGVAADVDMYIVSYRSLSPESELINESNRIFDSRRWILIGETTGMTDSPVGKSVAYIETEVRGRTGISRLIRHWYVVNGRTHRSPVVVKLIELGNALLGRPSSMGVLVISTQFGDDAKQAAAVLDEFMPGIR